MARLKARLVTKEYSQLYGLNYVDTFSSVTKMTFVWILVALTTYKWQVHQLDIKKAFPNGILDEKIYMKQPQGFVVHGDCAKVCRLKKSLYGLKQSPRAWFGRFALVI